MPIPKYSFRSTFSDNDGVGHSQLVEAENSDDWGMPREQYDEHCELLAEEQRRAKRSRR